MKQEVKRASSLDLFADLGSLKDELAKYFKLHKIKLSPEELMQQEADLNAHFDANKICIRYLDDLPKKIKKDREAKRIELLKQTSPDYWQKHYALAHPGEKYHKSQGAIDKLALKEECAAIINSMNSDKTVQIIDIETKEMYYFDRLADAATYFKLQPSEICLSSTKKMIMRKKYFAIYRSKRNIF